MNLVTLSEVKTELGVTTGDDDALLTILIDRVSISIQKYIGYDFDFRTIIEYYEGNEIDYFTLLPTNDDDSVTVVDRTDNTTQTIDLIDSRHILLEEKTVSGDKNIKISYDFGYSDETEVPQDVKGVAVSWINAKYQENKADSVTQQVAKSEKIEDLSISYFSPSELQKSGVGGVDDYEILDQYKINSYV